MHRQNGYSYTFTAPTRYPSSHSTSSATSPSANPNEDWTKISDLAERRRIQNRIAQRNYRKKLKRRLEDLERRAGSSSTSPEQSNAQLVAISPAKPGPEEITKKRKSRSEAPIKDRHDPAGLAAGHAASTPLPSNREDMTKMFSHQYTRQLTASPPPAFTYSYPIPEPPPYHAPYPQHAPFHSLPAPYTDYSSQSFYLPPLPPTILNTSSYDSMSTKAGSPFTDDDVLNHFGMGYPTMNGLEIPTTQSYVDSNAYTPPLSFSHSFEHSRSGSPAEPSIMCPGTPLPVNGSPHVLIR